MLFHYKVVDEHAVYWISRSSFPCQIWNSLHITSLRFKTFFETFCQFFSQILVWGASLGQGYTREVHTIPWVPAVASTIQLKLLVQRQEDYPSPASHPWTLGCCRESSLKAATLKCANTCNSKHQTGLTPNWKWRIKPREWPCIANI